MDSLKKFTIFLTQNSSPFFPPSEISSKCQGQVVLEDIVPFAFFHAIIYGFHSVGQALVLIGYIVKACSIVIFLLDCNVSDNLFRSIFAHSVFSESSLVNTDSILASSIFPIIGAWRPPCSYESWKVAYLGSILEDPLTHCVIREFISDTCFLFGGRI